MAEGSVNRDESKFCLAISFTKLCVLVMQRYVEQARRMTRRTALSLKKKPAAQTSYQGGDSDSVVPMEMQIQVCVPGCSLSFAV